MRVRRKEPAVIYDRHYVESKIRDREGTQQFRELDPEVQDEYRKRWRRDIKVQVDREDRIAGWREQSILMGAGFFLLLFIAMVPFGWPGLIVYPLGGAVFGWLMHVTSAGRFRALMLGPPLWVVTGLVAMACGVQVVIAFDLVVVFFTSAMVGMLREFGGSGLDPAGLRRRRARRLRDEQGASGGTGRGGVAEQLPTRADARVRPWGPAPQQGGDERRPAAWTEWDFDACDQES